MTPEHRRRAWRLHRAYDRGRLNLDWYCLLVVSWRRQLRTWRDN